MTLRVLVLTTETPHHTAFVRALVSMGHEVEVVIEHSDELNKDAKSEFQMERLEYEASRWFGGAVPTLGTICPTSTVQDLNTVEGVAFLKNSRADVAVAFGVGWLRDEALSLLPVERWNLHGGDPQKYRGLDSHLWSLYHRDRQGLVTTVHALHRTLDRGDIIAGSPIDLVRAPELYMLRAENTELAISLALGSLAYLEAVGRAPRMPQASVGRYYSALPQALLNACSRHYQLMLRDEVSGQ